MSKFIGNVCKYFLMICLSLIIIGFLVTFALFCAGNGDFVMGFIVGLLTLWLVQYIRNLYKDKM